MQERAKKILTSIIREYQLRGQPVASQALIERYDFSCSVATVRAQMLVLDEEGYLEQPHISAGRIPTDKALRFFVAEFRDGQVCRGEQEQIRQRLVRLHEESVKEVARFLADCTRNLGISGVFSKPVDFHEAGIGWLAEEPELVADGFRDILKSLDLLEEDFNKFFSDLDEEVRIFIGRENPIKYLRQCGLVVAGFKDVRGKGVLGILGPRRMDYQRNKFVVEEVRKRVKRRWTDSRW